MPKINTVSVIVDFYFKTRYIISVVYLSEGVSISEVVRLFLWCTRMLTQVSASNCLRCIMSYSRCLSLSTLLASTFIIPVAAMDLTDTIPDSYLISTHTYTPIPKPASLTNSYQTAAVCFLGTGDCNPNVNYQKRRGRLYN